MIPTSNTFALSSSSGGFTWVTSKKLNVFHCKFVNEDAHSRMSVLAYRCKGHLCSYNSRLLTRRLP